MRRRPRAITPSVEELEAQVRWGSLGLMGAPALTSDGLEQWRALHKSTWTPQHVLSYCWSRVDDLQGDPDGPWTWSAVERALEADRRAIAKRVRQYPEEKARLRLWVHDIEELARERNADRNPDAGAYYRRLERLGYDPLVERLDRDDTREEHDHDRVRKS